MNMKKINITSIALSVLMLAFFTSCEKWIDPTLNEDPNNPVDVEMELILPSIIVNMAYDQGGNDAVRTLAIWTQQFDGVARQSFAEGTFVYTPADCNNLWNSTYPNMTDLNAVIEKVSETNEDGVELSPYTRGMAKILKAEHLAFATNLWGDIPYSEALQGDANLNPKLDSQQDIYGTIHTLLDEAIEDLSKEESIVPIPSEGDMIFGGDKDAWLVTAYALKARYSLILSEVDNNAYSDAITYAQMALDNMGGTAFESNNGFVAHVFTDDPSGANPLYQFMEQRGDIVMASTFMDYLSGNNDPRIAVYGDGSGGGTGSVPTSQTEDGVDLPGSHVAAMTAPIRFMNLSELHFILAEAKFDTDENAASAHAQDGVYQSVAEAGIDIDAVDDDDNPLYDDFKAYVDAGFDSMEDIMTEKWVANYGTVQVFNDWRRTGYPVLTVPSEATNSEFPRRYPYSQEELTYNSNVSSVSIFSRLWWDAQ